MDFTRTQANPGAQGPQQDRCSIIAAGKNAKLALASMRARQLQAAAQQEPVSLGAVKRQSFGVRSGAAQARVADREFALVA